MTKKSADFWPERLGLEAIRSRLLARPIPASVTWLHTLGSVALALVLVLALTGTLLTLNYSPSVEHAYHSVRYIDHAVPLGRLVRALHHWAASFLVVVLILHLIHALVQSAFLRPRELTWVTGSLLLLIVLALSFTGYLLPWDEKAYWATVVGTSMAGEIPHIGDFVLHVLRGGEAVGAATLARFYGAHATLLPMLLATFLVVHLYFVVLHGIARKRERRADTVAGRGPPRRASTALNESEPATVPFWPQVLAMDTAATCIALALLLFVALHFGAPLEAPADPTNTEYIPRPEWYFLPLFQLLKYFPGRLEPIAAVVIPLVSMLVVAALPWWAAPAARSRRGRITLLGGSGLALVTVVALGVAGAAPTEGVSPPDPVIARGRLLFDQLGCTNCHSIRGVGGIVGPDLTLVGLRRSDSTWLAEHLRDPRSIAPTSPMPPFPLEGESLGDLVAFLLSLGNDLRYSRAAPQLYAERCVPCHRLEDRGGTYGPDLGKVGRLRTVAFIHQYMEEPLSLNADARMPPTVGLSHEQVEDLARYVVATALSTQSRRE